MLSRRHMISGVVALGCLVTAGCTGTPGGDESTGPEAPSAADRLAQSHEAIIKAGTFHLELVGEGLPEDEPSLVTAATGDGTIEPPAFQGTVSARMRGVQADVPVIATAGKLFVKLPYVGTYVETKPSDLQVQDPALLLDKERGLVGLLPKTEEPEFGKRSRLGQEVVQEVTGKLPGAVVRDLLWVGDESATFMVTYSLVEESWQTRQVRITGPFYPPDSATFTLTLTNHGEPVSISEP